MAEDAANSFQTKALQLDMSYNRENPTASALELVYTVKPKWNVEPGRVKITPLVGGALNTVRNFKIRS